jgi:hypothetical protein
LGEKLVALRALIRSPAAMCILPRGKMHQTSIAIDAEFAPNPQLDFARFLDCLLPDAECLPFFMFFTSKIPGILK